MSASPSALRVAAACVVTAGLAAYGNTGLAHVAVKSSRILGETTSQILLQQSFYALIAGGVTFLGLSLIARKMPASMKLGCSLAATAGMMASYTVSALSN